MVLLFFYSTIDVSFKDVRLGESLLLRYLQGESDDFEALLHRVKMLLVEGVVHNVRPQLDVLAAQVPESTNGGVRGG